MKDQYEKRREERGYVGKERGGGKPWDVRETLKELVKDAEHQKHVVCKMLAHVVCKMLARDRRNNRDRWSTTAPVNHIMAAFAITVAIRAELDWKLFALY